MYRINFVLMKAEIVVVVVVVSQLRENDDRRTKYPRLKLNEAPLFEFLRNFRVTKKLFNGLQLFCVSL